MGDDDEYESENDKREEVVGDAFFFLASKEANACVHGEECEWVFFFFFL